MKRFITAILTFCMLIMPITAFAKGNDVTTDYMEYDFPEDAVVLYQNSDGVVYQTHEGEEISTYSTEYESVWINKGKYSSGNFPITNPHTIINKTQGTFKIESEYKDAKRKLGY